VRKLNLGVLASHGGSNLQAIIDNINSGKLSAKVTVVISNNSKAYALERARKHNIPAIHLSNKHFPNDEDLDLAIVKVLKKYKVDLVIFAGYMKKRGPKFLQAFPNRVLNIHPALLPKFGGKGMYGMKVHEEVLASGEKESGATVHLVDEYYDHGRILGQRKVPVLPNDTPETLAQRVLKEEHKLYSEVIQKIALGKITVGL
jgi:phosphoribosylglycinamide formyltransferase-1